MKLEKDHAIIETTMDAAVFGNWTWPNWDKVPIERERVLAAITPKEGDAVFAFHRSKSANRDKPGYGFDFHDTPDMDHLVFVKANALTIGKTVGQLRELLTWVQGEE